MTITYGEMVRKLAKSGLDISEELTASDAHLVHMAMGVSGEAGEILDAIKKGAIYRKPYDMENLIEELGDIEFYLEGLRQGLAVSREEVLAKNMEKLSVRYNGFEYSDDAAQKRADKQ